MPCLLRKTMVKVKLNFDSAIFEIIRYRLFRERSGRRGLLRHRWRGGFFGGSRDFHLSRHLHRGGSSGSRDREGRGFQTYYPYGLQVSGEIQFHRRYGRSGRWGRRNRSLGRCEVKRNGFPREHNSCRLSGLVRNDRGNRNPRGHFRFCPLRGGRWRRYGLSHFRARGRRR